MAYDRAEQQVVDAFIEALPQAAAETAEAILREARAASAQRNALNEEYQDLLTQRGEIENEIAIRKQEEQYGSVRRDPQWHAKKLKKIAALTKAMERNRAKVAAIPKQLNGDAALLECARQHEHDELRMKLGKPMPKGVDELDEWNRRREIKKTWATERERIENAPLPVDVVKAAARKQLAHEFGDGAFSVTSAFIPEKDRFGRERHGQIRFKKIEVRSNSGADFSTSFIDAAKLLSAVIPDLLEKAVMKAIDDKAKQFGKNMMTTEQRTEGLAESDQGLLDSDYDIEVAFRAARAAGHDIVRSPRTNMLAVLQVEVDDTPRRRKSSPDDSWMEGPDSDPEAARAKSDADVAGRTKMFRERDQKIRGAKARMRAKQ